MLLVDGGFGLALFALWVFCLIDVIRTDESRCRNLRKTWWVLIVVLLVSVGALSWLIAGRPWTRRATSELPDRLGAVPEDEGSGRFSVNRPEDDQEFLRRCRERAEEQRRVYREQQRGEPDGG